MSKRRAWNCCDKCVWVRLEKIKSPTHVPSFLVVYSFTRPFSRPCPFRFRLLKSREQFSSHMHWKVICTHSYRFSYVAKQSECIRSYHELHSRVPAHVCVVRINGCLFTSVTNVYQQFYFSKNCMCASFTESDTLSLAHHWAVLTRL